MFIERKVTMINIEDFRKVEMIVVRILEVSDHPNADKLYVIKVDTGTEKKQVVAGIKQFYAKEELVGKEAVLVYNLEPVMLRGVESQGMILAVKDDAGLSLITPHKEVKLGSRVS